MRNNLQVANAKTATQTYHLLMNLIGDNADNRALVADCIRAERGNVSAAAGLVANELGVWIMREMNC